MIKAKCNNGDLIFGLSKENITRLQKGQPIVFNLKEMGLEDKEVVIMYGETEDDMYKDLVDLIDLKKTKIHDEENKVNTRVLAMDWWNNLSSLSKTQICDTNTNLIGSVRRWETLTGREIESLWNTETKK
jgi:hypothetical protein